MVCLAAFVHRYATVFLFIYSLFFTTFEWECNVIVLCQSIQAPNANSSTMNDTFEVVATVFELNGAEPEENRIITITKMVLKLMKQNGCSKS
jgi:hypothetical protein